MSSNNPHITTYWEHTTPSPSQLTSLDILLLSPLHITIHHLNTWLWLLPDSTKRGEPHGWLTSVSIFTLRSVAKLHPTLCNPLDSSPPGSSVHGIFQSRILEVSCHFLLQGIFPTQGSKPHLLHWQVGSLAGSHWGWQFSTFEDKETIFSFHLFYSFILNQKWYGPNRSRRY